VQSSVGLNVAGLLVDKTAFISSPVLEGLPLVPPTEHEFSQHHRLVVSRRLHRMLVAEGGNKFSRAKNCANGRMSLDGKVAE